MSLSDLKKYLGDELYNLIFNTNMTDEKIKIWELIHLIKTKHEKLIESYTLIKALCYYKEIAMLSQNTTHNYRDKPYYHFKTVFKLSSSDIQQTHNLIQDDPFELAIKPCLDVLPELSCANYDRACIVKKKRNQDESIETQAVYLYNRYFFPFPQI